MRNLSVAVLMIASLTACSDTQEDKKQHVEEKKVEQISDAAELKLDTEIIKKDELSLVVKNEIIKQANKESGKLVFEKIKLKKYNNMMINNQKFELLSDKLIKGAKVFNLQMSQPGIVKGTFVVVVNNGNKLSHFDHTAKLNKIAKNTYQLTPEKEIEFLRYYKLLLGSKKFRKLEMEIDYSGENRRPLTEER
jgi:hypothetical protein